MFGLLKPKDYLKDVLMIVVEVKRGGNVTKHLHPLTEKIFEDTQAMFDSSPHVTIVLPPGAKEKINTIIVKWLEELFKAIEYNADTNDTLVPHNMGLIAIRRKYLRNKLSLPDPTPSLEDELAEHMEANNRGYGWVPLAKTAIDFLREKGKLAG